MDDPRIGHLMGKNAMENARVVILGFPGDEGVRRNGGRVGAAQAPDAIRTQLYNLTPDARNYDAWCEMLAQTFDAGNILVTGNVEQDQEVLGEKVSEVLQAGAIPIILGGGHETAFGHFLGYAKRHAPVHIINIDAHADVRPLKNSRAHSGSPFFQALEYPDAMCAGYAVYGLAPWSVAHAHVDYLQKKNCTYCWKDEVSRAKLEAAFGALDSPTMVTMDMDVVDRAGAPGVSAPASGGLDMKDFWYVAYLAGRSSEVTSLDIVEVNPVLDIDNQTVKAAAVAIWYFLQGMVEKYC